MTPLEQLLHRYRIPWDRHELNHVFTHHSVSEKNNSRYVFLGMFGFKDLVAEYLFHHIAGSGMQLQHFLGNLFKLPFLEKLFQRLQLQDYCRIEDADIATHRHIFVYALFGYLYENGDEQCLKDFITREIILPNDHLLPENHKSRNRWDQLIFLCKQQYDKKPKLEYQLTEHGHEFRITLGEKTLGSHSSIGYKYAKKKAVKEAIRFVSSQIEEKLRQDEGYLLNEKLLQEKKAQEIAEAKAEKQRKHLAKNEDHAARMREKRKLAKQKAQEEDKKRREIKQKMKEKKSRKGKNTIYREYTMEEIQAMSSAKRRNLQDRGILPQNLKF
ncbi:hypothetical protein FO675_09105 [Riemerella anatipestifer]|uniref:cell envelope integrity protein TolA n=1 Tax=Riemerella anatipestifer TaxID=34085 RepID=UPI001AD7B70E|nr:hypothetical protein [Riemerella anatipestifer]MBO4234447.1 hypothetical protein [Riemerella anatipestifer]